MTSPTETQLNLFRDRTKKQYAITNIGEIFIALTVNAPYFMEQGNSERNALENLKKLIKGKIKC